MRINFKFIASLLAGAVLSAAAPTPAPFEITPTEGKAGLIVSVAGITGLVLKMLSDRIG